MYTHLGGVSGCKRHEILHRLRHRLAKQANLNATRRLAANGYVEKDL